MARAKTEHRLDPPVPALHPERDALLRACRIAHLDDRLPYLVYADWQDDNGRPEHAELIRVMCEMEDCGGKDKRDEKRKHLDRVKELFATPALKPLRKIERNIYNFSCGFPDLPTLCIHDELPATMPNPLTTFGPGRLDAPAFVPFDMLTCLKLDFDGDVGADTLAELAACPWVSRVTDIELNPRKGYPAGSVAPLAAAMPELEDVDAHGGLLEVSDLVALLSGPGLRSVELWHDVRVAPDGGGRPSAEAFAEFVRRVFAVPSAARFTEIELHNRDMSDAAARVLLESPYLTGLETLSVQLAKVKKATLAALLDKYPNVL